MSEGYVLRPMADGDRAFIINSWLKSYYDTPHVHWVPEGTYYRFYHDRVQQVLDRCGATIACNEEDASQIFGWVCRDGKTIHYVYVKQPYRTMGIAHTLIGQAAGDIVCTHWTRICEQSKVTLRYKPGLFWDGLALRWAKTHQAKWGSRA